MATQAEQTQTKSPDHDADAELPPVRFVTPEEGREIFDYQARSLMGMSGEEFVRRWDAGEFDEVFDGPDHFKLVRLYLMLPFARQDPE